MHAGLAAAARSRRADRRLPQSSGPQEPVYWQSGYRYSQLSDTAQHIGGCAEADGGGQGGTEDGRLAGWVVDGGVGAGVSLDGAGDVVRVADAGGDEEGVVEVSG